MISRAWFDGGDGFVIPPSTTDRQPRLSPPSTMAALHKVKIAARLRPRLDGEIVDDQIKVHHNGDSSSSSTSSNPGGSYISVTNPRDQTQIFKFPSVNSRLSKSWH